MIRLLDVNVLIAVAWPSHAAHEVALAWFDAHADSGWATCPITQSGFVRVSSNRSVFDSAVRPADAAALLGQLTAIGEHEFWPDATDFTAVDTQVPLERLVGHRQVTDAHLLGIARSRGGSLATLDRGIETLARGVSNAVVDVVTG